MLVVTEKLLESIEVNLSYRKFKFEQPLPFNQTQTLVKPELLPPPIKKWKLF